MVSKIWLGGFLLCVISQLHSQPAAEKRPLTTALIQWSEDFVTPAICLGHDQWFISVMPGEIDRKKSDEIQLQAGGKIFDSEILHLHPTIRLCLIQAPSSVPTFSRYSLANLISPDPGTELHCKTASSKCRTTVAGKDHYYLGNPLPVPLLRVRISEKNHVCQPGTPLVNAEGDLVGLLTERVRGVQNQAHAIPVSQVHKLVHEFERFQKSGRVWVGMVFHNHSTTPEVLEVRKDSPAEKAGVLAGDVVLKLNNEGIENLVELAELIRSLPAGEKTGITVLRGHERIPLSFVPQFASVP